MSVLFVAVVTLCAVGLGSALWLGAMVAYHLYVYYRTDLRDNTLNADQYREERQQALRDAQIAYREQARQHIRRERQS